MNSEKFEPDKQTLQLPAVYVSLDEVRDFVGAAAEDCGLKPAAVYQVQMAVDEAFTNIIEHAYGGESQAQITCTCQIEPHQLVVSLQDQGRDFRPEEIEDPDVEAPLEERDAGGLGLFFIRNLMDEVQFEFTPPQANQPGCNILTMIKRKEAGA